MLWLLYASLMRYFGNSAVAHHISTVGDSKSYDF